MSLFIAHKTMEYVTSKLSFFKQVYWRTRLWTLTRLVDLFRYRILGTAQNATLDDIEVLHADSEYIFVEKRYDVLVNSNKPEDKVTVETQLKRLFPNLVKVDLVHSFHFVHRLDYATSGVLCIACTKEAAARASKAFSGRLVKKYYLALVRGHVGVETIDIDLPIGDDSRWQNTTYRMCLGRSKFCCKPVSARTRLLVLQYGLYDDYPATKVLLSPITGRRHQLRLHCAELGHTIVGDYAYSNRRDVTPYRMFLHAHRLMLPAKTGVLDINAGDPFTERDPRNRWSPTKTVNNLDVEAYRRLDSGKALITLN